MMVQVALILVGGVVGFVIAWLLLRSNNAVMNARLSAIQQELTAARGEMGKLQTAVALKQKEVEDKSTLLSQLSERLQDSFKALSAEALKSNNQAFLQLASASLQRFQTEAEGNLKLREQAVENLVAPI